MCGFRVLSAWVKRVCVLSALVKQVYVGFHGVIYFGKTGVCGVSVCYLHG